jgi:AcrR family transcriptional regulator
MSTTRQRIVETTAELFRRQGYNATGIKRIVTDAKAPFGSIYHFFPGGKEQLGAEVIRASGAM